MRYENEMTAIERNTRQRGRLLALAACAGLAAANLYYSQPMLGLMASDLGDASHVGLITALTQLGYTAGMILLVPLCDSTDRGKLILALSAMLAIANLGAALAPSLPWLLVACAAIGVGTTITQMIVPIAAELVSEHERGKAIGVAFGGVLTGILMARVLSGAVSQWFGWRVAFGMATGLSLVLTGILALSLPPPGARKPIRYVELLASVLVLPLRYRALRFACAIQACVFGAFSAFWSELALFLQSSPWHFGPGISGAFGFVGVIGVLAAQAGGRMTDRYGARCGVLAGVLACGCAFALFGFGHRLSLLIAGVILLDLGLSLAQVSNQSSILGLSDAQRSRINTAYVTLVFLGGTFGSAGAAYAWLHWRWAGVSGLGAMLIGMAFVLHVAERRSASAPVSEPA